MAINNPSNEQLQPAVIKKKTYEKPGFRFEQVFVTSALSCGKVVGGVEGGCSTNTKVS